MWTEGVLLVLTHCHMDSLDSWFVIFGEPNWSTQIPGVIYDVATEDTSPMQSPQNHMDFALVVLHICKKGTTSKNLPIYLFSHHWGTIFIEYLACSPFFFTIFSSFGETNHLLTQSKAESLVGRMAWVPSKWWLLIRTTIAALGTCSINGGFSTSWVTGG